MDVKKEATDLVKTTGTSIACGAIGYGLALLVFPPAAILAGAASAIYGAAKRVNSTEKKVFDFEVKLK